MELATCAIAVSISFVKMMFLSDRAANIEEFETKLASKLHLRPIGHVLIFSQQKYFLDIGAISIRL